MFCPHCGNPTELVIGAAPAVAEAVDREVEIARINAGRDIEVAKISARQDKVWNETRVAVAEIETDATVAAAAVEGQVLGAVLDDDAPEPAPDPIVIDAPDLADDEEIIDDAPPPASDAPAPTPPAKPRGLGLW